MNVKKQPSSDVRSYLADKMIQSLYLFYKHTSSFDRDTTLFFTNKQGAGYVSFMSYFLDGNDVSAAIFGMENFSSVPGFAKCLLFNGSCFVDVILRGSDNQFGKIVDYFRQNSTKPYNQQIISSYMLPADQASPADRADNLIVDLLKSIFHFL